MYSGLVRHPRVGHKSLKITLVVGTMWTAYLFTLLTLVSAPAAFKTGDKIIIVAWIAQTFLQLVLLPIIIVGQNVQAAAADARSLATYNDASAVLEEAKQIQALEGSGRRDPADPDDTVHLETHAHTRRARTR